jgi:hypothetical protein
MLQEILSDGATPAHQLIGRRQTEYHNPKFLSFHCGSAQFFSTIAADSVELVGATGVESEQATSNVASKTRMPNRIAANLLA